MTNKGSILSIIIPIYNVEKYIGKCLESIISQIGHLTSEDEIEIVIVNDGTPDNSMSVVGKYGCQYDYIRIINQDNKGLSAARNAGLKIARSKYVWFFDSDDYLKENTLAKIVANLTNDIDLYILGLEHVNDYGHILYDFIFPEKDDLQNVLSHNVFMAQLYIVRRDILINNDVYFYEGIYHEDVEFTPRMLSFIKSFMIADYVSYCYLKRSGSITMGNDGRYNIKRAYDTFKIIASLSLFRIKLDNTWKQQFSRIISLAMNNVLQEEYRFSQNEVLEINVLFYENRKFFKHLILSHKLKYAIEGFIFFVMPKSAVKVFRYLKHIR